MEDSQFLIELGGPELSATDVNHTRLSGLTKIFDQTPEEDEQTSARIGIMILSSLLEPQILTDLFMEQYQRGWQVLEMSQYSEGLQNTIRILDLPDPLIVEAKLVVTGLANMLK